MQQTSGHRMLRNVAQQRIGTLESALRFQADAKQLRSGYAAQRGVSHAPLFMIDIGTPNPVWFGQSTMFR